MDRADDVLVLRRVERGHECRQRRQGRCGGQEIDAGVAVSTGQGPVVDESVSGREQDRPDPVAAVGDDVSWGQSGGVQIGLTVCGSACIVFTFVRAIWILCQKQAEEDVLMFIEPDVYEGIKVVEGKDGLSTIYEKVVDSDESE